MTKFHMSEKPFNRNGSVFVLEDEPLSLFDLKDMLEQCGWHVKYTASTVPDGMAVATTEQFDIAILDVNLDGVVSYPIAWMLNNRGIPFILITGFDANALRTYYPRAPIVQKPYRRADLDRALAQVLFSDSSKSPQRRAS